MSIGTDSRFNFTVLVRVQDEQGTALENDRIDLPYPVPAVVTKQQVNAIEYTVRSGDTWHGIAARFFRGRSDLWWIIAEFSGTIDPYRELNVGDTLLIPSLNVALFDVLSFDNSDYVGMSLL